jgi:hypothetical protein
VLTDYSYDLLTTAEILHKKEGKNQEWSVMLFYYKARLKKMPEWKHHQMPVSLATSLPHFIVLLSCAIITICRVSPTHHNGQKARGEKKHETFGG